VHCDTIVPLLTFQRGGYAAADHWLWEYTGDFDERDHGTCTYSNDPSNSALYSLVRSQSRSEELPLGNCEFGDMGISPVHKLLIHDGSGNGRKLHSSSLKTQRRSQGHLKWHTFGAIVYFQYNSYIHDLSKLPDLSKS
jgi:hypothetical protein